MRTEAMPANLGFDAARAGRRAECDGGGLDPVTGMPMRQEFSGTLTGEFVDHGDPPWRWYLMAGLERKPDAYPADTVWCEAASLFLEGE
ncbi:MAG: hypothetical protein U0807_09600 [Candidatus Binatia bacterium]